jgi:hypothetical protein
MKKAKLMRAIHDQDVKVDAYIEEAAELRSLLAAEGHKAATLAKEVEQMKAHWRPVPITHEWQPKNPQCMLCDEPRDAARHRVDTA